jgi:hypothetical protein
VYAAFGERACGDKAGHAGTEDEHIDIVLQGEFRLPVLFSNAMQMKCQSCKWVGTFGGRCFMRST